MEARRGVDSPLSGPVGPVETPGIRIEVVGADLVPARVDVQRAAFSNSTFQ